MSIDFKGFTVYKNDMLPPNTLMVSPDVYEKLTETPEQREAREANTLAGIERVSQLINARLQARGLSPTGRSRTGEPNHQDLPKGLVPGHAFEKASQEYFDAVVKSMSDKGESNFGPPLKPYWRDEQP